MGCRRAAWPDQVQGLRRRRRSDLCPGSAFVKPSGGQPGAALPSYRSGGPQVLLSSSHPTGANGRTLPE